MKISAKKLKTLTILSAIATCILGVLAHFAYDFFGQNVIAALIFPISESTWEHLKLLYFPMLLCLVVCAGFLSPERPPSAGSIEAGRYHVFKCCYITGMCAGLFGGVLSIIVLYYTLTGVLGYNIDWLNIVVFVVAVLLAYFCFYRFASASLSNTYFFHNRQNRGKKDSACAGLPVWLAVAAIAVLGILFFVFTFYIPPIQLFKNPVA